MNGSSKLSWYAHRLKAMSLPKLWHRVGEMMSRTRQNNPE